MKKKPIKAPNVSAPQQTKGVNAVGVLASPEIQKLLLYGCLLLYGVVLLRTAWLCDDAYITFRTVDNFINGFGLRWNSPMGPLRFEWGFPIARRPGEDLVQFNFTIGNYF